MAVVLAFALNTIFNFAIGLLAAKFLGPAEYGRFALASALAVFINAGLFDWLRMAAVRFYSERTRANQPQVRATLDLAFALVTLGVGVAAILFALSGIELQLSSGLLVLAAAAGATNGMFDFHAAIARARFDERSYVRMIAVKHALALVLTVGGAWWFQDARVALAGVCLSIAGAMLASRRALIDKTATPERAERALMRSFLVYSAPLVAANVIVLAAPLFTRSLIASRFGFAEMGQFSLAFDVGMKLVLSVGATIDVMLFQIAVRCDELQGRQKAKEQLARNLAIVTAVAATTCVGFWLTLPSFETLLVPQSFRGPFATYVAALLPGFFAFSLTQHGVVPIFQIAKRTKPAIAGALASLAATGVGALIAPAPIALAQAQSVGFGLGFLVLVAFALAEKPVWPRARDFLGVALGVGAMAACLWPMRAMAPGAATLLIQVCAGALVATPLLLVFDVGAARGFVLGKLRGRLA